MPRTRTKDQERSLVLPCENGISPFQIFQPLPTISWSAQQLGTEIIAEPELELRDCGWNTCIPRGVGYGISVPTKHSSWFHRLLASLLSTSMCLILRNTAISILRLVLQIVLSNRFYYGNQIRHLTQLLKDFT